MKIFLSEQLKQLRKKKGNTQKELAMHLGITTQSVSKWERDDGYPDITLLPAIASYYNVSVDDLLGVGVVEKEKKLNEYKDKGVILHQAGKNAERVSLWREAQKEFPNDLSVICELMYALATEDSEKNELEIIACGKMILENSTDNCLRAGAIQMLCFAYSSNGDKDKAKEYARMANNYYVTSNQLMAHALDGEEAVEFCQGNIQSLVEIIGNNALIMLENGKYCENDRIKILEFVISYYELLYCDGNCGFYHRRLSEFYEYMAKSYLKLDCEDKMMECLERAAEHAIKFDTMSDGMFTSLMVNKVKKSSIIAVKNHTENRSGLLLKALKKERFAHLQDNSRMVKIIEKLEQVAVM